MPVKDLAFETLCVTVDDQVLTVTLDAIAHTKSLCNRYISEIFEQTHAAGFALEMLDFRSRDHREAIAACKEGRPPVFTGS